MKLHQGPILPGYECLSTPAILAVLVFPVNAGSEFQIPNYRLLLAEGHLTRGCFGGMLRRMAELSLSRTGSRGAIR